MSKEISPSTPPFFTADFKRTPTVYEGGRNALVLAYSNEVDKAFELASEKIKLSDFDVVLVNSRGGWFTFNKLSKIQNYQGSPTEIEVHRTEEGYGAVVVTPVPEWIKNNKDLKVLVIDDISDTNGTLAEIMKDLPNATALVAVNKKNVPGKIPINGPVYAILETQPQYWVYGLGMNADTKGDGWPEDFGRELPCLMIKLPNSHSFIKKDA